jgi:hypothetical protein
MAMSAEARKPPAARHMLRARRAGAVLVAIAAVATGWVVTAPASPGRATRAETVHVVFRGKGGGRYLDTTRWLREDTRECYARRVADETLVLSWEVSWTARLRPGTAGYELEAPASRGADISALVHGTQVRDSCDSVQEEPGWDGSARCDSKLPVVAPASVAPRRVKGSLVLALRAPRFGSPGRPCELDIRNDQLVAHALLSAASLERIAAGKTVTLPVGTRHPGPGDAYTGTRLCSLFPHIYEGVVYLYDCEDVLVWSGTLTVSRG